MPILKVTRYVRQDAQNNPTALFVFGDNDLREGYGGQAKEMRGEDNAVGIRTKWAPGTGKDDYFSDSEFDRCVDMINEDLEPVREHLSNGGIVVLPVDGLGTGLSQLPRRAPRVFRYLEETLAELEDI